MTTNQAEDGPTTAQMEAGAQALRDCGYGLDGDTPFRLKATVDSVYRAMQEAAAPQVHAAQPVGCGALPGVGLVLTLDGDEVYSCSGPTVGSWQALASFARAQYMSTMQQQMAARHEEVVMGAAQPAGDAAMKVVAWWWDSGTGGKKATPYFPPVDGFDVQPCVRQSDAQAAMAAKDAEIAALTERVQFHVAMTRDAQQAASAAQARMAGLEADLVEERNRIASMRTEWAAEVAALTAHARDAEDNLAAARARIAELETTLINRDLYPNGYPDVQAPPFNSLEEAQIAATKASNLWLLGDDAPSIDAANLAPAADTFMHAVPDRQAHYPEEWGPSNARRLTCVCGNPDPSHMSRGKS